MRKFASHFTVLSLGALVGILGTWAVVSSGAPKSRTEPGGVTVYGWPGPCAMREDYVDADEDGLPEQWSLNAWGSSSLWFSYFYFDDDEDGISDDWAFTKRVGDEGMASLHHLDADSDGKPEMWQVSIVDQNGDRTWYSDFDGDGLFDLMYEMQSKSYQVLYQARWTPVVSQHESGPRDQCEVELDGIRTTLSFTDGAWRIEGSA